jgi:phenylalanyl-tRNA synthetase alpha chain
MPGERGGAFALAAAAKQQEQKEKRRDDFMQAIIEELARQAEAGLAQVTTKDTLSAFWQEYLSKNGKIPALMKNLRTVAAEERPAMGKVINELKQKVQSDYEAAAARVQAAELAARNAAEAVDITMPAKTRPMGGLHPLTLTTNQIIDAFAGMGFEVFDTPEIEDDDHNFTLLNVPKDHPARDMQDTFYLSDELLLRTQTSNGQIRSMERGKLPIKVLVPGRVFRSDSDATHSPMFHQMEGLVVDKGINLCDLQGMLDQLVRQLFGEGTRTRLRPSYFPFTEPSVEVDVSCFECGGKGCSLCKHTGWIEVLGGGVVNRKVLANCGIDPDEYSGIAFGIGIERIAMLKYGINNIGLMFENDLRFLKQFQE